MKSRNHVWPRPHRINQGQTCLVMKKAFNETLFSWRGWKNPELLHLMRKWQFSVLHKDYSRSWWQLYHLIFYVPSTRTVISGFCMQIINWQYWHILIPSLQSPRWCFILLCLAITIIISSSFIFAVRCFKHWVFSNAMFEPLGLLYTCQCGLILLLYILPLD